MIIRKIQSCLEKVLQPSSRRMFEKYSFSVTQSILQRLTSRKSDICANSKRSFFSCSVLGNAGDDSKLKSCDKVQPKEWDQPFVLPKPELDWSYLLDKRNTEYITSNIENRKGVGNIDRVHSLAEELADRETNGESCKEIEERLLLEALEIPNMSHPEVNVGDETQAKILQVVGKKRVLDFKPRLDREIAGKGLKMFRDENMTFCSGSKTYFLEEGLVRLEKALVEFTVDRLLSKGFDIVSVPDLLYGGVIDSCGFKTTSDRSQVYKLQPESFPDACLAGTAEMSLAGYFMNEKIPYDQLPTRIMAVSRCYRAEAGEKAVEKGLYRVHHFTKVEMFGLAACESGSESDDLLKEFLDIEKELFSDLNLHFRMLEMPTQELGAPAYKKFDIEAWMDGKGIWGEISSCSNCTDFQSRRLNIKYQSPTGGLRHVHTVNGTACAVPRMITSILEQNQSKSRHLPIPEVLHEYMDGQTEFSADLKKSWYTYVKTLRKV